MSQPPSIAFVGLKRTGKDTAASYLIHEYGYEKVSFADPLREMAAAINPIVSIPYHDGWEGMALRYNEALNIYGYETAKELFPEVRRFLQVLGTEGGRGVLGENVWVDALTESLEDRTGPFVATDVRFPNEADALADLGFLVVRIHRDTGLASDPHPSENSMGDYPVDLTIRNDSSIEDLELVLTGLVFINAIGRTQP